MIEAILETHLQQATPQELESLYDKLFEEARCKIESSHEWPLLRDLGYVSSRRKRKEAMDNGHYFLQRCSRHFDLSYDEFRKVLFEDHSLNETKYVELMVEAKRLAQFSCRNGDAGIFQLTFKATLASGREFIELVVTREDRTKDGRRYFMVVSKPVKPNNLEVRSGHVRGQYEAWELVQDMQDGSVEWTCVQRSNAGGWVPNCLVDWFAGREFCSDVDCLMQYIKSKR